PLSAPANRASPAFERWRRLRISRPAAGTGSEPFFRKAPWAVPIRRFIVSAPLIGCGISGPPPSPCPLPAAGGRVSLIFATDDPTESAALRADYADEGDAFAWGAA